ncbi:hypothetical protein BJ085DRAFT_27544 [Dimargaris cristalligena]|uniref:Uncharacterized protein n=1 Tax=Dimargaris cristalligena TaxID=215637 RepID=A0A4Q0A1U4_9FUNG|nr:hypothetical protein BJ085DRAFT_27544 [Dimargaris cristalligena]|eukprot:RKP39441.1 hypothetical protein BJ085DRAFT_27544 [Dimargaris cristalligena]
MANDVRGLRTVLADPANCPLLNNPIIRDSHGCFNSLMLAVSLGHVECAQLLMGAGADVNYTIDGVSPLFWAIRNPGGLLQLLVDPHVNIDALDGFGKSALQHAREKEFSQSLEILQAEKLKRQRTSTSLSAHCIMPQHLY